MSCGQSARRFLADRMDSMHRQFQLIAAVAGLMCIAGCCGGPCSPYQARQAGAQLSACLNSPICSHHRHRAHDPYACPPYGTACPPGGDYCMRGPVCGGVCNACDCEVGTGVPSDAYRQGLPEYDPSVVPPSAVPAESYDPHVTPPPAVPAESEAVPELVPEPDPLQDVGAYGVRDIRRLRWEEESNPRVMLPGQRVSRSERRTTEYTPASTDVYEDEELPLIIPAQR